MQIESIGWSWENWLLLGSIFLVALAILWSKKFRIKQLFLNAFTVLGSEDGFSDPGLNTFDRSKPLTRKSLIKITNRNSIQNKQTSLLEFEKMIQETPCLSLSMHELWDDTIIDSIYLTYAFSHSLSDFLGSGDKRKPNQPSPSEVEIGGFLMGRYARNSTTGRYLVLLEAFIPIEPEKNNIFHLEFSTYSLMMELGDAQDQFPELVVVGWFHTHPGHGLFLSTPDLAIQRGFFNEKFQFAMEIDSLTPDLDLAFFTYRQNGQINNTSGSLNSFSWRKLEDSI